MTETYEYRHKEQTGVALDSTGEVLVVDNVRGRDTVTVTIDADVSSDFALDVDTGDGTFVEYATYSGQTIAQTETVAADRVRVRNTTAQTAGDTADVRVGAS